MNDPTTSTLTADQALYARMRQHHETAAGAATALAMDEASLRESSARLHALGLIRPQDGTAIGADTALARVLDHGRSDLAAVSEQLRHTRAAVDALAGQYLPLSLNQHQDSRVELIVDRARIEATLNELTDLARHETMDMQLGPSPTAKEFDEGLARDAALRARGVRMRALYSQHMATGSSQWRQFLHAQVDLGIEIRFAAVVPTRLITFDRQHAVLQIDPADHRAGAVVLHGRPVIAALCAMFDYCWNASLNLADVPTTSEPTEQQRATVRMLAAGLKDDAIARSLGASVRTVTRLVSEVMTMLDARSRFQAGVRAARLGWLD